MSNYWVVVAHRAGARVFLRRARHAPLERVHAFEHPAAHLADRDHGTSQPGRTQTSVGGARHALSGGQGGREHAAEDFARELAEWLAEARNAHRCNALVLVAEPHMLGLLRAALDPHTLALVRASVALDLVHVADDDIAAHLGDLP